MPACGAVLRILGFFCHFILTTSIHDRCVLLLLLFLYFEYIRQRTFESPDFLRPKTLPLPKKLSRSPIPLFTLWFAFYVYVAWFAVSARNDGFPTLNEAGQTIECVINSTPGEVICSPGLQTAA